MALPEFPADILVVRAGYTESADHGVVRTDMDGGIAKQRARWSLPIVTRQVTLLARSLDAKTAMDAFVANELAGGAKWFTWSNPASGAHQRARLVGGAVEWSPQGSSVWQASCQIETLG